MTDVARCVEQPVVRAMDTGLAVLLHPEAKYQEKFGPLFNQPTGQALIHYMSPVGKISSKGKKQNRIILLSNTTLYLTELDSTVKRCVPVRDIQEVLLVPGSGCVAFRVPREYDILLEVQCQDVARELHYLINILKVLYQKENSWQPERLLGWVKEVEGVKKKPKDFSPPLAMSRPKGFKLTFIMIPVLSQTELEQMRKVGARQSPLPDVRSLLRSPTRVRDGTPPPPVLGTSPPRRSPSPEDIERNHPLLMKNTTEVPPRPPPAASQTTITITPQLPEPSSPPPPPPPTSRPPVVETATQVEASPKTSTQSPSRSVSEGTKAPSMSIIPPEAISDDDDDGVPEIVPPLTSPPHNEAPHRTFIAQHNDTALLAPSNEYYMRRQGRVLTGTLPLGGLPMADILPPPPPPPQQMLNVNVSNLSNFGSVAGQQPPPPPPPPAVENSFLSGGSSFLHHPPASHLGMSSLDREVLERLEKSVASLRKEMVLKDEEINSLKQTLERDVVPVAQQQHQQQPDYISDLLAKISGGDLLAPSNTVRTRTQLVTPEKTTQTDIVEVPVVSVEVSPTVENPILETTQEGDESFLKEITSAQVRSIEVRKAQIKEVQDEVEAMVSSGRYTEDSYEIRELRRQLEALAKDLGYEAKGYEIDIKHGDLVSNSEVPTSHQPAAATPTRSSPGRWKQRGSNPPPPASANPQYPIDPSQQHQLQEMYNQYYQYYYYYHPYYRGEGQQQQQQQQQQQGHQEGIGYPQGPYPSTAVGPYAPRSPSRGASPLPTHATASIRSWVNNTVSPSTSRHTSRIRSGTPQSSRGTSRGRRPSLRGASRGRNPSPHIIPRNW